MSKYYPLLSILSQLVRVSKSHKSKEQRAILPCFYIGGLHIGASLRIWANPRARAFSSPKTASSFALVFFSGSLIKNCGPAYMQGRVDLFIVSWADLFIYIVAIVGRGHKGPSIFFIIQMPLESSDYWGYMRGLHLYYQGASYQVAISSFIFLLLVSKLGDFILSKQGYAIYQLRVVLFVIYSLLLLEE